jgi:hypothetical protein
MYSTRISSDNETRFGVVYFIIFFVLYYYIFMFSVEGNIVSCNPPYIAPVASKPTARELEKVKDLAGKINALDII